LWTHAGQAYLKELLAAARGPRRGADAAAHARVALRCMCSLLIALPHFNYASDLLQAIVPSMASRCVALGPIWHAE
jgi:nucleolar complex protein 3